MTALPHRLVTILLAVPLSLAGVVAAVVWWGPVSVSDKRPMLNFLLGRGIAPPSEATVAERPDREPHARLGRGGRVGLTG